MNSASGSRATLRAPFFVALGLGFGLALALGAATVGCGPKEKYCPNTDDGVCPKPVDAGQQPDVLDAPAEEMGSIFIGDDASSQ